MLTLKTTFENDTRRRQFASNGSLADLKRIVGELYGGSAAGGFALKYVDDDGDLITLGSEAEMRECVTVAEKKNNGVMRVSVFRVDAEPVAAKPAAAAAATVKDEEDESDDDDDNSSSSEQEEQQPFAALQTFFEGLVQGEEGSFSSFFVDFFLNCSSFFLF